MTTTQDSVHYDVDGSIATFTLNRPRYRNVQSWQMLDELDGALECARAHSSAQETPSQDRVLGSAERIG